MHSVLVGRKPRMHSVLVGRKPRMHRRDIFNDISSQKDNKKISVIIGARQVGKSTILKALYQKLGGLFLDSDILLLITKKYLHTKAL